MASLELLLHFYWSLIVSSSTSSLQEALANGECVVIGLLSTGEALAKRFMESVDGDNELDFLGTERTLVSRILQSASCT